MDPGDLDDDAILGELRDALSGTRGPLAERLTADAQAAFTFLSMDDELAALLYDSALEPELAGAARSRGPVRTLVFGSDALSVELEITGDEAVGQVAPPGPYTLSVERSDGGRTSVVTDDLGCFALASPQGLVRLRVDAATGSTVTEWVRVQS